MPVKLRFQELKVWPTLTPGTTSSSPFVPQEVSSNQDDIWASVLLGERKTTAQGENAVVGCFFFFLIKLTFPWIPNPLPTLCSPYKKGHLKMEFKTVC